MSAIVCSAAEMTVDSGAFATTIPRRVAASTSTLSIPTPARPMTFRRVGAARSAAASSFVAERIDDRVEAADRSSRGPTPSPRRRRTSLAQQLDARLRRSARERGRADARAVRVRRRPWTPDTRRAHAPPPRHARRPAASARRAGARPRPARS